MRKRGWSRLKKIRTKLRYDKATPAEGLLWEQLKGKKFMGLRFRRQHGIAHFVVDFYHARSMTVIELDGSIHDEREVKEYDKAREEFLIDCGYKIIRFKNEEVYHNLEQVLNIISLAVTPNM